MSKKYYPTDLLKQAQSMRAAWAQIDSKLAFGELTTTSLGLEIDQARTLTEEIDRIETALVDKRNQLDAHYAAIHGSMKRIRAAIKGIYGDDSSQYEMIGGTRMSERKLASRKPAA